MDSRWLIHKSWAKRVREGCLVMETSLRHSTSSKKNTLVMSGVNGLVWNHSKSFMLKQYHCIWTTVVYTIRVDFNCLSNLVGEHDCYVFVICVWSELGKQSVTTVKTVWCGWFISHHSFRGPTALKGIVRHRITRQHGRVERTSPAFHTVELSDMSDTTNMCSTL